ncbi:MAG: hypothetical protein RL385_3961 [Pseudomonadota bacterium]|jgi:adenosylcobinamide amidohydrolase
MSALRLSLSDDERFLEVDLGGPHRTLGWALHGGGFGVHRHVVWHFVRREELTLEIDAKALLVQRLSARGMGDAVGLLTARHLPPYGYAEAEYGHCTASALATVGLGNALRIGDPPAPKPPVGTINVLVRCSVPLTDEGLLEALSLAVEARTLGIVERGYPSVVSGKVATGTGTDCVVVAAPHTPSAQAYAGKHTDVGAAIGESVLSATRHATQRWLAEQQGLQAGE